MRRIGICCALSLLMLGAVARAAPIGPHSATAPRPGAGGGTVLFGDQTIEQLVARAGPGQAETFPYAVRRAGTVSTISIYVDAHNKAKKLIVALYSNRSGAPVRRVSSGTLSSLKAGSWNTISVTRTKVRSASTYWIAVLGQPGMLYLRGRKNASCHGEMDHMPHLSSLPQRWNSDTRLDACPISAYAKGHAIRTAAGVTPTFGTLAPSNPTPAPVTTTSGTLPQDPTPPALPAPTLPPVMLGAPTVSGNPVQGDTLTSSTGSWADGPTSYAYQWQDCNTLGICASISGATSSSYTLQASDVGSTIRSVVTATNAGGSTPASSAHTATVTASPPAAPTSSTAPAVTGQPVQGQTLTTNNGSWTGNPTSYTYHWQDCNTSGASCANISGATSTTYTLQASDVGDTIRSVVTATNAGGSTPSSSGPTATVTAPAPAAPTNSTAPTVTGQTVQGQTLTTTNGGWTGSPTSYTYKWQDCNSSGASCANISGATFTTYTLQASDVGSTIRSVVTGTNAGGSTPASSAPTGAVTSGAGTANAGQVGAPTPSGVTCTQSLSAGADVGSALSSASPGAVVCLNSGGWSALTLSGITPSSPGVTLAAAPGSTVVVPGFSLSDDSNLTVEGFSITDTETSNSGIDLSGNISDVTLEYNTIENQANGYGIYSYPGPGGETANGVSILYNQIDKVGTGIEADGDATETLNWTISHNVIGPDINYLGEADGSTGGHYIQIGGVTGATIDNNAFEGPQYYGTADTESHLNVLHCFSFGPTACTNLTFDNNILWHVQTRAQSILITDYDLTNIQLENNLDVEDPACEPDTANCPASPWFIEKANGIKLLNNTSANAPWSINLGTCGDGCISNPSGYNAQDNIATGPPQQGQNNYGSFACNSSCLAQNNVSQDNSASTWGSGTGDVDNWTPNWQTTNWTPNAGSPWNPPPQGYYQPVTGGGVTASMGWQGSICTATIRTNCIGP